MKKIASLNYRNPIVLPSQNPIPVQQEKNRQTRSANFSVYPSAADTTSAQDASRSNVASRIAQPLKGKPPVSAGTADASSSTVIRLRVIRAVQQTDGASATGAAKVITPSSPAGSTDIPVWLTKGSAAGVNYQHGINISEAMEPGSSQRMTFQELIGLPARMSDEAVTDEQQAFIASTRITPILEWAKENGIVPEAADYSYDEINNAIAALEQHQNDAEKALQNLTSAPVMLKDYFTGTQMVTPLKSSVISSGESSRSYPVAQYDAQKFKADFNADLQVKKAAYGTIIKSMLATLPLEDRKAIEFGKVQLYSLNIKNNESESLLRDSFIIEAVYQGKTTFYEVNPLLGIVRRRDDFNAVFGGSGSITRNYSADGTPLPELVVRNRKTVSGELRKEIEAKKDGINPPPIHFSNVILKPVSDGMPAASSSAINASVRPQTLSSQRSNDIANTVSEKLFYVDDQALLDAAMEDPERVTQAQQDDQKDYVDNQESREHRRETLKGFVPFYKPIENMVNGGDRVSGMGEVFLDGALFFLPIGKFFSGSIRLLSQLGKPLIKRAFPNVEMQLKRLISPLKKNSGFRSPSNGLAENITTIDASIFKSVNAGKEQFKVNATKLARNGPGEQEIEFNGKKYFAAEKPDAGDGEHYLLRVQDTKDPSKLVSSSIIAKPDAAEVWQRRGIEGGMMDPISPSVASDLGPEIGRGGEGIVYESIDGKSVYKDFGSTGSSTSSPPNFAVIEKNCLNKYYGEGFAEVIVENNHLYIKMGKLDGIPLSAIGKHSLPPEARSSLIAALTGMEEKGIYHQDLQFKNLLYSTKENKIYPVDIQSLPPHLMVPGTSLYKMEIGTYNRRKTELLEKFNILLEMPQ